MKFVLSIPVEDFKGVLTPGEFPGGLEGVLRSRIQVIAGPTRYEELVSVELDRVHQRVNFYFAAPYDHVGEPFRPVEFRTIPVGERVCCAPTSFATSD